MSEDDSMPPVEDPAYASMSRQHVSDAAAKNLGLSDELVRLLDRSHAWAGNMLVTVAEWDACVKDVEEAKSIACYWLDRAQGAEAKLAAAEEFTRQYADRVMATNAEPDPVTPRADHYRALLTVAEPTHRLGGDKAR
jgi:hypothetical protein